MRRLMGMSVGVMLQNSLVEVEVGRTGVGHTLHWDALARSRDHPAHVLVLGSWPRPFMDLDL